MTTLSVLDLATVAKGATPADALADTTRLARIVESLGYHRMWVAEHHGMPAVASSAPAVLVGHLADATTTLRVGAGGVMLPNHAPLVVAEQFATLEALHPGRIDLGLGRAPGTDPATARALRRSADLGAEHFPEDVVELIRYLVDDDGPPTTPAPVPGRGYLPQVWLLGSSTFSAQLAGMLGLPFSFAFHFAPALVDEAVALYRANFRRTGLLADPYVMVAASVLCADTDEEADHLAGPSRLTVLQLRQGTPAAGRVPRGGRRLPVHTRGAGAGRVRPPPTTPSVTRTRSHGRLAALVERTGADELMLSTRAHSLETRARSLDPGGRALGPRRPGRLTGPTR